MPNQPTVTSVAATRPVPRCRFWAGRRSTAVGLARFTGVLVLATALLVGCSGKDGSDSDAKKAAATTTTSAVASVSPEDLPEVPGLTGAEGVRADLTVDACSEKGALEANGSVKNTAKRATDIVVTVNWINADSDVLARGVDVLEAVGAGKSVKWSVSSTETPATALSCSINAQRGSLD